MQMHDSEDDFLDDRSVVCQLEVAKSECFVDTWVGEYMKWG
jgi:hypothetical protein